MSKRNPRVTIGVPVFNGESFLAETLESLLSQTFHDFEIVISDNGSTDRTKEICQSYATRDSRVRYYWNDVNRGAAWNYNHVFELATGEYFKWNAADDLCAPEFLARCVAALDQDPSAVMAISEPIEIDECGQPFKSLPFPGQNLLPQVPPDAPAHVRFRQNIRQDHLCLSIFSLIRLDILRRTNLIGNYPDSDRILLAHLALLGHCVVIPEVLLLNRDHPGRFCRKHNGFNDLWREQITWFDPSKAKRRVFPFWKEFFELWRVIPRTPLKWQDRLRCYSVLVQWLRQDGHMRRLYLDATWYPRKWVVRHFPQAKVAWNWLWGERNIVSRAGDAQSAHDLSSQSASVGKR